MLREKSSGMRKGIRERKVKVAGMGRVLVLAVRPDTG